LSTKCVRLVGGYIPTRATRILAHLLTRIRNKRGEDAIAAVYALWHILPAAVLHTLLSGDPRAGPLLLDCPDLTEILHCARAGPPAADGIEELRKEGHVLARAHREYQATFGLYKVELADVRWKCRS
jgi:hypothetical protein